MRYKQASVLVRYVAISLYYPNLSRPPKSLKHIPVDGGYPVVAPVIPPIEETDDAVEVALPKCVAEPEYPP